MVDFISSLEKVILAFLPIILAITLHEAAHGYVAMKRGDMTAYRAGRVSFNPFRHVDLVGTLLIPGLLFLSHAPFLIGYAKPVPVDARNLHNPRLDMAWVAVAGPGMNIILCILSAIVLKALILWGQPSPFMQFLHQLSINMIFVNIFIGLFNLLPILPLDGGRILSSCLKPSLAVKFQKSEPYGMLIIMGLVLVFPWVFKINPIGMALTETGHFVVKLMFLLFGIR